MDDSEATFSNQKDHLLLDRIEKLLDKHILNRMDKTDTLPVKE